MSHSPFETRWRVLRARQCRAAETIHGYRQRLIQHGGHGYGRPKQHGVDGSCGTGVLGQGGLQDPAAAGALHGPGVMGIGGGAPPLDPYTANPTFYDYYTGSVGVFGQGGDANKKTTATGGVAGPHRAGPGVMGRGGLTNLDNGDPQSFSTGVIGVAGDRTLGSVNFLGRQGDGVGGYGNSGAGGYFESDNNRAGIFLSKSSSAQVQLVPHEPTPNIPDQPFPPRVLNMTEQGGLLPTNGQAGDLLCTSLKTAEGSTTALLWFCVKDRDSSGGATWRQVVR
jgi:hypothetical protein